MPSNSAIVIALFGLTAAAALGCGDDPAPSYLVSIAVSESTLSADGSDSASLTVTVVDENDVRQPTAGDTVPVQCQATSGAPAARIDNSDDVGVGLLTLDTIGIGTARIACAGGPAEGYQFLCIAVYEGERGTLAPVTCAR